MTLLFAVADLSEVGGGGVILIKSKAIRAQILRAVLYQHTVAPLATRATFHSTQKSANFGWYIKWNGPFRFGPTRIFGTSFEGGPLWPLWSFRSAGPKCPFPFEKIVVPSATLFCPAYKNNNQTECTVPLGMWNFQNFRPKFLLSGERPTKSWKLYTGHPGALNSLHFFRVRPWYCAKHSP